MRISSFLRLVLHLSYAMLFIKPALAQPGSIDSFFTEKKLKEVVYEIADDSLQGRLANSAGCNKAAHIIARRMEATGLLSLAEMNNYFQDADSNFQFIKNIIGAIPGTTKKEEIIIISAHYDHLGLDNAFYRIFNKRNAQRTDTIFNGANDNASGVAVMLALSQYFISKSIARTLLFVAFSGEEEGQIGSQALCAVMSPDRIVAQINLEMLGRKDIYKRPFITGNWYSNLYSILNHQLEESTGVADYFRKDINDTHSYFQRSDNYPFAIRGIPAHTIMLSTDNDRLYHHVGDAPKMLDYKMMGTIAKNIALAIEPMVQGMITPQRIDVRKILEDKKRLSNKFR